MDEATLKALVPGDKLTYVNVRTDRRMPVIYRGPFDYQGVSYPLVSAGGEDRPALWYSIDPHSIASIDSNR